MSTADGPAPLRMAAAGLVVTAIVAFLVGTVVFGDPWTEVVTTAVGTGVGVSIAFYVYYAMTGE